MNQGVNDAKEQISSDQPDWSREVPQTMWDPSRKLLKSIRAYHQLANKPRFLQRILKPIIVLRHRFWSVVCASDIPLNCQIDGGLMLPHPNGVVIHPDAKVGANCLLLQQVTLVGDVVLEGHVDVGSGAKIIRPVTVGAHAQIGANAVVLEDVPPHSVVAGIPAKVVKTLS